MIQQQTNKKHRVLGFRQYLALQRTVLVGVMLLLAAAPARAVEIEVNSLSDDGAGCTLREAIIAANEDGAIADGCVNGNGSDKIVFDLPDNSTISLTMDEQAKGNDSSDGGGLAINDDLEIDGSAVNNLTISASAMAEHSEKRVFWIAGSANVVMKNLKITGGATMFGGGIYTNGGGNALTLINVVVYGNTATNKAGGIYVGEGDTLTLDNSTVRNNTADLGGGVLVRELNGFAGTLIMQNNSQIHDNIATSGGGIFNDVDCIVTINNSIVRENAADLGGGIRNFGTLSITNSSQIKDNTAGASDGGGIRNSGALTLTNSTISGNTAVGNGGGIYSDRALSMTGFTITGNTADIGGGIYVDGAGNASALINSSLSDNNAPDGGGGIYHTNGMLTLNNSTVSNNDSLNAGGGGIRNLGLLTVTNGSVITGNTAQTGGGIYSGYSGMSNNDTVTVSNSVISNNTATFSGGGIYGSATDKLKLTGSTLSGNSATNGGGVRSDNILTLTGVTVSNNTASSIGGGVYASGATLNMTGSTIDDNIAGSGGGVSIANTVQAAVVGGTISGNTVNTHSGGFYNNGTLTLTNSTIVDNTALLNGGGVSNTGTLTLTNSTVSGNTANTYGGGFYNNGTLTLTNSTISGNTANTYGGGFYNNGTLTLTNSTISGNTANTYGGGGLFNNGTLTLTNSTIVDNTALLNGGGLYNTGNGGVVTLLGNILANNRTLNETTGLDCAQGPTNLADPIISQDYNLVESAGSCAEFFTPNDKLGVEPLLSPLALWGGPTATHVPLPGSPAIGAITNGNFCTLVTDQRGVARPVSGCDIGAVEVLSGQTKTFQVTTTADSTDVDLNNITCKDINNNCSLRAAIMQANHAYNNVNLGDIHYITIILPAGEYVLNVGMVGEELAAGGDLDIRSPIMIIGAGPGQTIIRQTIVDRVFHIGANNNPGSLMLQGVTITGGSVTTGGGIFVANNEKNFLAVENSEIMGNAATGNAGGIIIGIGASSEIRSSTIHHNTAGAVGGGVYVNNDAKIKIINSTISTNSTNGNGGGLLLNTNAQATVLFSTITNNTADANNSNGGDGGGIYNLNATVDLIGTIIAGNTDATALIINSPHDCSGTLSGQFNLIGNTGGCTYNGTNSLTNQSPNLLALANYGGPVSTHVLANDSVAVDAVNDSFVVANYCPTLDARGAAREKASNLCDMGAVELVGGLSVTVTPSTNMAAPDANFNYAIKVKTTSASGNATVTITKPNPAVATVTLPNNCNNATLICTLTNMVPDVEQSFVVSATAVATGTATLSASATAAGLKSGGNGSAGVTIAPAGIVVGVESDVLVGLYDSLEGSVSLTLTNTGSLAADALTIELTPTSGVSITDISLPDGCAISGGSIICTIGALAALSGQTTLTFNLIPVGGVGTAVKFSYVVKNGDVELIPATELVIGSIVETPLAPDLQVSATSNPSPAILDQPTVLSFVLRNIGTANADGATWQVAVTEGFAQLSGLNVVSNVGGEGCSITLNSANNFISCNGLSIASGGSATITIKTTPTQLGAVKFALSSSAADQLSTANDQATFTLNVEEPSAALVASASADVSDVSLAELAPVNALAFKIANNGTGAGSVSAFNFELNELGGATVAYIVPVTLYRDNNGNGVIDNDDTAVAETTATTGTAFALSLESSQAIAAGSQVAYIVEIDPSHQTQVASLGGLGSLALNLPLAFGLFGFGLYGPRSRRRAGFVLLILALTITASCGSSSKSANISLSYQVKLVGASAQDQTSNGATNVGGLPLAGSVITLE